MKLLSSTWVRALIVVTASVGGANSAGAHHSYAMFDKTKSLTLKGQVDKIEWRNPHVYILLNVAGEDGKTTQYAVECSSPNELQRWGWKANSIKAGDSVTVTLYPFRSGKPGGLMHAVTLPNGVEFIGN